MKIASARFLIYLTFMALLLTGINQTSAAIPTGDTCRAYGENVGIGETDTYVLRCGSQCAGTTNACSIQKDIINDIVSCGCSDVTIDCCHLIGRATIDPLNGTYVINSWDYDGDCLSCPLSGACQVSFDDKGTQTTTDDRWTAICD